MPDTSSSLAEFADWALDVTLGAVIGFAIAYVVLPYSPPPHRPCGCEDEPANTERDETPSSSTPAAHYLRTESADGEAVAS